MPIPPRGGTAPDGPRAGEGGPGPGGGSGRDRGDESDVHAACGVRPDAGGDLVEVPLVRLARARSGDKGDTSNIGVVARNAALVLRAQLTAQRVAAYLAHLVEGPVVRYELPGIGAFNFVCERALGGGGMTSLRNDPLGKGMAQMLLSMPMRVDPRCLDAEKPPGSAHSF